MADSAIRRFTGCYSFLSNFHPAIVFYDHYAYPSAEHAYQAAKTTDLRLRWRIAKEGSPNKAKGMGRRLELRPGWEDMKLDVMLQCLRSKFADPVLKELLLKTGTRELVEGNSWGDRYWGVFKDEGENHLGKILMRVREECVCFVFVVPTRTLELDRLDGSDESIAALLLDTPSIDWQRLLIDVALGMKEVDPARWADLSDSRFREMVIATYEQIAREKPHLIPLLREVKWTRPDGVPHVPEFVPWLVDSLLQNRSVP